MYLHISYNGTDALPIRRRTVKMTGWWQQYNDSDRDDDGYDAYDDYKDDDGGSIIGNDVILNEINVHSRCYIPVPVRIQI